MADAELGTLQLLDRAVRVLSCLERRGEPVGVRELGRLTGISTAACARIVGSLVTHRLVEAVGDPPRYRLGIRLFELGSRAAQAFNPFDRAYDQLNELASDTGETAHLGILSDGMMLYLAKVEGWHALRMPSQVGRRIALHCCALGKCLLAFVPPPRRAALIGDLELVACTDRTLTDVDALEAAMAQVRADGYAIDDEELEVGLRCVAAPISDESGAVTAAISISGPVTRLTDAALPAVIDRLVQAARTVSVSAARDAPPAR